MLYTHVIYYILNKSIKFHVGHCHFTLLVFKTKLILKFLDIDEIIIIINLRKSK